MSEWKKARLGDLITTNRSSYSAREGWKYVNYLDTGNITENVIADIKKIDLQSEKLPSRAKRKVQHNSIVYSTVRPNQRHYGIIKEQPGNFLVSTGFTVIDPDEHRIDADFLYFMLSQDGLVEHLHAIAEQSVSAYPSIKASDIENLEVELPPLEEQKKIASILCSLTDKMRHNMEINKNLEQQMDSLYSELFIQNADPLWTSGTISDLGDVIGGSTPSKKVDAYYTNNGIAWITPKDLSQDRSKFFSHGEIDITELGLAKSSAVMMPAGTVLFSSRAPIGSIAIAANELCTNQGFKSVVPKADIGTAFVYCFLKTNLPTIESMASGSTFKEVSGSTMKSVPAVIPHLQTIARFDDFSAPLLQEQQNLESENRRLAEIRDSLLLRLMSGEIDVSDIDL